MGSYLMRPEILTVSGSVVYGRKRKRGKDTKNRKRKRKRMNERHEEKENAKEKDDLIEKQKRREE